ncbi:hypothetical protein [Peribacillus frigoritolerans]|uniref:hypothetical protein n=1 Tax=Peribacillus castrilensis TaxID=2897690 RepID=UPI002DC4D543|nr:hypothetical protein [Peribacillus castrilensis]
MYVQMTLTEGPIMWGIANSSRLESVLLVIIDKTLWMMLPLQVLQNFMLHLLKMGLGNMIRNIMKCRVIVGKHVVSITIEMLLIGKVQKLQPNQHRLLMFIQSNGAIGGGGTRYGLVYNGGTTSTTKTQTTWNMDKTVKYTGVAVVYTHTDAYVQVATKTGTFNKYAF